MSNGNGPQEQVEPGRPAEPAEPKEQDDHGTLVLGTSDKSVRKTLPPQGSITVTCPNCRQPAIQVGREIICAQCDVTFAITVKKGAQVKEIGPIESLDQRVTKIETTVGITGDGGDTLAEAAARKEGAAELALEVAAEIESETPAPPAGPSRPASQDGVHTDQDEILGPRGDE